ncbi:MAG: DUF3606 domain-containing protein [Ferruginibacter sp.]
MSIQMQIPKDLNSVNLNNLGELVWWSTHLAITPELLLSVTDKVGTSAKQIRNYIRTNSIR